MWRTIGWILALSIPLNLAIVRWFGGDFARYVVVIPLGIAAVGGIWNGSRPDAWEDPDLYRRLSRPLLVVGWASAGALLAIPLGAWAHRHDIDQAKRYCEGFRPELERYYGEHREYPETLPEPAGRGPLPRLLRCRPLYSTGMDGSFYQFEFGDPSRLLAAKYRFDSFLGRWDYDD